MLDAFTIRDSAAEAFMRPFFAQSSGAAIRSFSDMVNSDDKDHPVGQHPEDYTLFSIGSFDEQTGLMKVHPPESLGNGATFLVGYQLPMKLEEADHA